MHGLVRTLPWEVREATKRADGIDLVLGVKSSDATRKVWPFDFDATFTLGVGPVLRMTLAVRNASSEPFTFEEGLHTYFAVSDVREVSVQGLRGHYYRDKNVSPDYQLDTSDTITFPRRTDRLYRDARGICTISDPGLNREIVVAKENSATTVVWNPGEMAPGEFADLGSDEWPRFVCVETCNARHNAYTLGPGQTHSMSAIIQARPIQ
jgi:glucose-6-phosphate 1-epimerase